MSPKDFTRLRKLSFKSVFTLILRNSIKSLQLMLNEFVLSLQLRESITGSAFSQARKKLRYTAFKSLNDDIVGMYYQTQDIKRFQGLRLLAIDGSTLTLPKTEAIIEFFGARKIGNGGDKDLGKYSRALFIVCYDVLNNIANRCILDKGDSYEVELAGDMLDLVQQDDLLILDRFYGSYPFFTKLHQAKINYLIRCSKGAFAAVQEMFKEGSPTSLVTSIKIPQIYVKAFRLQGLPDTIPVRLIRIVLASGEVEVLATSLQDEHKYPTELFADLYHQRWGIETFFGKIKGRLCLENFTGKTVEAIQQDLWSTIFISNLETIMTQDIEVQINQQSDPQNLPKIINRAVSFNAIKNLAFDILSANKDLDQVIEQLTSLFVMNPIIQRKNRKIPRYKISSTQSFNFHKRIKKQIF